MPENSTDRIREIEARIADLKARFPAHSVKPAMYRELEDLEEALEQAIREAATEDAGQDSHR